MARSCAAAPDAYQGRVTAKEVCKVVPTTSSTLRNWAREGLISALRVGNGPFLYDLDEVRAMVIKYPRDDVDERIRELIEAAPEFTPQQVNRICLLLHAAPEVSSTG